jgi:hypothetical protein
MGAACPLPVLPVLQEVPVLQEERDTPPPKKNKPEAGDVGVPGAAAVACQK